MRYLAFIAIVGIVVARQPKKPPESKGAAKGKSAQVIHQTETRQNDSQPATATPPSLAENQHPAAFMSAPATHDDVDMQRKLVAFTGLLVDVGFLQLLAMIGQAVIYCRQAKVMTRQAQAREMMRQRGFMRLQWNAMQWRALR
jgi:hypothetical protein